MPQILVKTPRTINGRDVVLGTDGKIVYKETILEAAAKATLVKQNAKLPQSLKMIIEDIPEQKVKANATA